MLRFGQLLSCLAFTGTVLFAQGSAELPLAQRARDALANSSAYLRSISTEGGYVWLYAEDLSVRAGEALTTPTQAWVQPPGTPSIGSIYLRAFRATGEQKYLDYAGSVAQALARGQLKSGGWDYLIEFDPKLRSRRGYLVDAETVAEQGYTTFDDNTTQSALSFLIDYMATLCTAKREDAAAEKALSYGLDGVLRAQYPVGAWPQRWDGKPRDPAAFPVKRASIPENYPRKHQKASYYSHYTLNDNAQRDMIEVLLQAWKQEGETKLLEGVKRGAEFLLLAQLPAPQPVWAQQYDAGMQPAWARAFEPPSVCTAESANVVRLLVELYLELGDKRYLEPVAPALAWFKKSEIAPGRWARLYELGTNRPIYGDRDGEIHYTLEEVSEERRRGYAWESDFGIPETIAFAEAVMTQGREAYLQKHPRGPFAEKKPRSLAKLEPLVTKALDSIDAKGRWLIDYRGTRLDGYTGKVVLTRLFIENMAVMCEYLEVSSARK